MNDLKSYQPPKTLCRQSWEVFGALFAIIVLVCMGIYMIFAIGGPAIDDQDQAQSAIEQPIAKELAKRMKGEPDYEKR